MGKTIGILPLLSGKAAPFDWHDGFDNDFLLTYCRADPFSETRPEYMCEGTSVRLDLYVCKRSEVVLTDEVGRFFTKHNLISYKSPMESYLPADFLMHKSYNNFFQREAAHKDVRLSDISLTAFTTMWPEKLLLYFADKGIPYMITGSNNCMVKLDADGVKMQIVCVKRLTDPFYTPLYTLRNDLQKKDLDQIQAYMDQIEQTGSEDSRRRAQRWIEGIAVNNQTLFFEEAAEMEFWKKVVYEQYGEQMNQKDQQLADKDQQLAEKKRELSSTRQKLTWRNKKIAQQGQTIAQRDQMIAQQSQTIAERDQTIAQQGQTIAQRDQTIAEKDSSLVNCARQMIRIGRNASEIAECTSFSLSRLTRLARSMGVSLVL